jgi:hypothetical protein
MSDKVEEQVQEQEQTPEAEGKLVPVIEAVKYRRRAQKAEGKLAELEQQLKAARSEFEGRLEQLATAEAQRDELQQQLDLQRLRSLAQRELSAAGVADLDAALTLLEKRLPLSEEVEEGQLAQAVEQLVADKPFLLRAQAALPGATASPRVSGNGVTRLAQVAGRARGSGSRRDLAQYLRLRRQG